MNQEDIKRIVADIENRKQIHNSDIYALVYEYVSETKNIKLDPSMVNILQQVFGIDSMLHNIISHYKTKYFATTLYDKKGNLLKVWF